MCPTMVTPGDGLPLERKLLKEETRRKFIHPVGAVARVQWRDLGGHGYTGIFSGASSGVIRSVLF